MNKRVIYLMAFLLPASLAFTAPSSAIGGAQGSSQEKNISIKIIGDDDVDGYILIGDENKVKSIKEGEEYVLIGEVEDEELIEACESYAFMGINMEDLTEKMIEKLGYPKDTGVLITNVLDDSAADKFGLKKNDIIYSFAGEKISKSKDLAEKVRERKPGESVEIVFYRDGKKKKIEMELGERTYDVLSMDMKKYEEALKKFSKSMPLITRNALRMGRDWHMSRGTLGLVIKDMDEDLAAYFDAKPGEGILVIEVTEESPADEAGIKAGDIVVEIAGKSVKESDEFIDEVYECTDKDEVEVVVLRKGKRKGFILDVSDAVHTLIYIPDPKIKRLEITEPEIEIHRDEALKQLYEKQALEEEIKSLQKELERLKKRLDKIEKE